MFLFMPVSNEVVFFQGSLSRQIRESHASASQGEIHLDQSYGAGSLRERFYSNGGPWNLNVSKASLPQIGILQEVRD